MAQWDIYSQSNPMQFDILISEIPGQIPMFKSDIIEDYQRFRLLMQILDLMVLDIYTFKYDKRKLIASTIYLTLGLSFKVFTKEQVVMIADIQDLIVEME